VLVAYLATACYGKSRVEREKVRQKLEDGSLRQFRSARRFGLVSSWEWDLFYFRAMTVWLQVALPSCPLMSLVTPSHPL
jgi:hypothetical protein